MNRENLRILIIEDDALIAMDIQGILEAAGYRTIWLAPSMKAVVEELAQKICDIALLDIGLGDFDVFELADLLVEMNVKVIFVSGHSAAVIPERHRHRTLVAKPYLPAALLQAIERES